MKVAPSARIIEKRAAGGGCCFWLQNVQPKDGAWVEMTAGQAPLLVCGRYGQGKVAIVAGSVLGNSSKQATGFWQTNDWVNALSRVIHWMVFEN